MTTSDSAVKKMMNQAIAFAKPFEPEIFWECVACGADFPGEQQPPYCYNCEACGYGHEPTRKRLRRRAVPPPEYTPPQPDDNLFGEED
jgi:hypothetical protein